MESGKNQTDPSTDIWNSTTATLLEMLKTTLSMTVEETIRKIQDKGKDIQDEKALTDDQEWECRKRFLSVHPPEFHGLVDPIAVSDWILGVENVFKICQTSEDDKVSYASFLLRGNALHWWNTITSDHGKETMKWEEFKALIFKNFSPKNLMLRLEESFANLRQGNMSVRCYTNEFLKLSRFASDEDSTNERKIKRFIQGLDQIPTSPFLKNLVTFEEVVEEALLIEDILRDDKEEARPKKARKRCF